VGVSHPGPEHGRSTSQPHLDGRRHDLAVASGVDEIVLSLYAKGLTTGEITAHFTEIYGASVSKGGR
jgi:putative transposase